MRWWLGILFVFWACDDGGAVPEGPGATQEAPAPDRGIVVDAAPDAAEPDAPAPEAPAPEAPAPEAPAPEPAEPEPAEPEPAEPEPAEPEPMEPEPMEPEPPVGERRPPYPELPTYSLGECPILQGAPDRAGSLVDPFPSGEQMRRFRLVVPSHYDGSEPLPLVMGWHWLNASSGSFWEEAEMQSAVEQMNFIAVLPDALRNENDDRTYLLSWPFAEVWGYDAEMTFLEDMLACVTEQFNIDQERIYGIGVSAGGLWLTTIATSEQSKYFAAIEVLSGGLGDMLGVWRMEYTPQPNKLPTMVLWGGPGDWLALSFHEASMRLRDELVADDHFVVECTHDAGHGVPPVEPPPGDTRFRFLWRFMFDHPYSEDGSPYLADGLPDVFPDWCAIPDGVR